MVWERRFKEQLGGTEICSHWIEAVHQGISLIFFAVVIPLHIHGESNRRDSIISRGLGMAGGSNFVWDIVTLRTLHAASSRHQTGGTSGRKRSAPYSEQNRVIVMGVWAYPQSWYHAS